MLLNLKTVGIFQPSIDVPEYAAFHFFTTHNSLLSLPY